MVVSLGRVWHSTWGSEPYLFMLLGFACVLFIFAYTFLLSTLWRHALDPWVPGRKLDCGQLHCLLLFFFFSPYSQRLLRKTWRMPSWSWSNHTEPPRVSPAALCTPRSSLRRTSCSDASSGCHLAPAYDTQKQRPYFCIFTCVFSVMGNPFPWHSRGFWEVRTPQERVGNILWPCFLRQEVPGLILRCKDSASKSICWANPYHLPFFSWILICLKTN